jgi:hypothetical protein
MSRYLTEKCCVVEGLGFWGFAGVLEGVLEKRVIACGAFVVRLWWIAWQRWREKIAVSLMQKMGQRFKVYFFVAAFGGGIPQAQGHFL